MGGVAFGPRILTEVVPGLTLLLVLVWQEITAGGSRPQRFWGKALYAGLAALAIFVHSFQGLYNSYATSWNFIIDPIPDLPVLGLGDLFNWRYTQLLASPDWNCAIKRDRTLTLVENLAILKDYEWGRAIRYNDDLFSNFVKHAIREMDEEKVNFVAADIRAQSSMDHHLFIPLVSELTNRTAVIGLQLPQNGTSLPETNCRTLSIIFRLDKSVAAASESYALVLTAGSYGEQPILLEVNGTAVEEQVLNTPANEPASIVFLIPGHQLNWQGLNEIKIQLPEARSTGLKGSGYSGLTFVEANLYPSHLTKFPLSPTPPPLAYP